MFRGRFKFNRAVIANEAERSEAICQIPADSLFHFQKKLKILAQLKDKYSAGIWKIASLHCVALLMNKSVLSDRVIQNHPITIYFSTPHVFVYNNSIGNATNGDNARSIRERMPNMHNFASIPADFRATMDGAYSISSYGSNLFRPIIHCGTGPFTSRWEIFGSDGTNYYNETLPDDGSFTVNVFGGEYSGQSWLLVRLTVTSSDNQVRTESRHS